MGDENANCSETHVAVSIVGAAVDPTAITGAIGLSPTFEVHVGDVFPARTRPRTEGIWSLSTEGLVRSTDVNEHVDWLLDRLPDDLKARIPDGARLRMHCAWHSATGHGGPHLAVQTLRRIADAGLDLDFDFYSDA